MTGWVKVHRKLLDKPIWINSTPEQKTILITLLMMVNHQERDWEWQGKPYRVAPGQVITSLESIANKCGKGISLQNVRTAVKRFEKFEFLTNKSTNRNRLITIVNWSLYQNNENELTSSLTRSQQAPNKQVTPNKNDKKIKNENEIKKFKSESYDEESVPYKLSLRLLKKIKVNSPGFKEPNLQKWSHDFRLMMERDKRSKEQIAYLIDWCQKDSFWKSTILSPAKLRKQFDQLAIKAKLVHKRSIQDFSTERPSHWGEPKPLTSEEYTRMKKSEAELL
ncbi:hypothetical protein ACIQYG_24210 [Peribacillus sp. NPDC096622]|uniref:hypothetical protein n=1 Tax=Peribacillus sp. NPDC096622 TaxID=3364396 RepID=UPI00380D8F73